MVMESAASIQMSGGPAVRELGSAKAEKVMRSSTAKAAALGAVDMRPTTGAGAPS